MPDLIALGTDREDRWRRGLPELAAGRDVLIGRDPKTSPASHSQASHSTSGASSPLDPSSRPLSRSGANANEIQRRHVTAIPWSVPWDGTVSRHHAIVQVIQGDRIRVTKDPRATNPIFYKGQPRESFVLVPGEHFVIGETTFTLARRPGFTAERGSGEKRSSDAASSSHGVALRRGSTPDVDDMTPEWVSGADTENHIEHRGDITEMAFVASALRQRNFRDTQTRIDLLARLPDLVAGSLGDDELFARVTDVLLRATPSASAVAIVKASAETDSSPMQILHYDVRDNDSLTQDVSTKLVAATLRRRDSVLHLWDSSLDSDASSQPGVPSNNAAPEYTAAANVDWAFSVPLRSEACRGWVLYITGSRAGLMSSNAKHDESRAIIERLSDDVKFAEVVGSLVSGIRQANQFQQRHAAMRRFFAPVVLEAIAGKDSESWLKPRECDLSVMFCDLRGFSRTSEVHSDQLLVLLEHVSDALGVMTRYILENEGVIGDFHGDAAMGFWGWPLPLSGDIDPKIAATLAAAKAASAIRQDYGVGENSFRCGIGIASGPAVAGRIGTVDQVKVTAFGPVVNLASRLEGLTKVFGVEILVDQETTKRLVDYQEGLPDDAPGRIILRYLGPVRVAGMTKAVEIHQLVVPIEGHPVLSESEMRQSRLAWDAFIAGEWDTAYEQLHRLPAWDRPKDVLLQKILMHHRVAPDDWDGILSFEK